jgi:hypothetical protein
MFHSMRSGERVSETLLQSGRGRQRWLGVKLDMTDQMAQGSDDRFEAAVIGAGQAGLAMGYLLAKEGRNFTILEAADSIGAAWRTRWDSLVLFTPRRYDSLPGVPFPGNPDGYPEREEVIKYLEEYASTFELPVQFDSPVQKLTAVTGGFLLDVGTRTVEAQQVVVATGPFQTPRVPAFASDLAPDVFQVHSLATSVRATSPKEPSSSSAAATRGSRSPKSCRERTGFTWPSGLARHPCRSVCLGETCSGG